MLPNRAAAPEAAASQETVKDKQDGAITGVTAEMEYSDDGTHWDKVTAAQAASGSTGLAAGTYSVRIAAADGRMAVCSVTVTAPDNPPSKDDQKPSGDNS